GLRSVWSIIDARSVGTCPVPAAVATRLAPASVTARTAQGRRTTHIPHSPPSGPGPVSHGVSRRGFPRAAPSSRARTRSAITVTSLSISSSDPLKPPPLVGRAYHGYHSGLR